MIKTIYDIGWIIILQWNLLLRSLRMVTKFGYHCGNFFFILMCKKCNYNVNTFKHIWKPVWQWFI